MIFFYESVFIATTKKIKICILHLIGDDFQLAMVYRSADEKEYDKNQLGVSLRPIQGCLTKILSTTGVPEANQGKGGSFLL